MIHVKQYPSFLQEVPYRTTREQIQHNILHSVSSSARGTYVNHEKGSQLSAQLPITRHRVTFPFMLSRILLSCPELMDDNN